MVHFSASTKQPDLNQSVVVDESALPSFAKAKAIFERRGKIITPKMKPQPYRKISRCLSEGGIALDEPDNREMVLAAKRRNSEDHDKFWDVNLQLKLRDTDQTSEKTDHGCEESKHKDAKMSEREKEGIDARDDKKQSSVDTIENKETLTSQAQVVLLQKEKSKTPELSKGLPQVRVQITEAERMRADCLVKAVLLQKPHGGGEESTTTTNDSGVSSANMSDRTPSTPSMEASSKKHDSKTDTWSTEKVCKRAETPDPDPQTLIKCGLQVRIKEEGSAGVDSETCGVRNAVDFAVETVQSVQSAPTKSETLDMYESPTTETRLFVIRPEDNKDIEKEDTPSMIMTSALKTAEEIYYPMDTAKDGNKKSKILKPNHPAIHGNKASTVTCTATNTKGQTNVQENQRLHSEHNSHEVEVQKKKDVDCNQNNINLVDKWSIESSDTLHKEALIPGSPPKEQDELPQKPVPESKKERGEYASQEQSAGEMEESATPNKPPRTKPSDRKNQSVKAVDTGPGAQESDACTKEVYEKLAREYHGGSRKLISDTVSRSPGMEKALGSPTIMAIPAPGTPVRIVTLQPHWSGSPATKTPKTATENTDARSPAPCTSTIGKDDSGRAGPKPPAPDRLAQPQPTPSSENATLDKLILDSAFQLKPSSESATLDKTTLDSASQLKPESATLDKHALDAASQFKAENANLDNPTLDSAPQLKPLSENATLDTSALDLPALAEMPANSSNALIGNDCTVLLLICAQFSFNVPVILIRIGKHAQNEKGAVIFQYCSSQCNDVSVNVSVKLSIYLNSEGMKFTTVSSVSELLSM